MQVVLRTGPAAEELVRYTTEHAVDLAIVQARTGDADTGHRARAARRWTLRSARAPMSDAAGSISWSRRTPADGFRWPWGAGTSAGSRRTPAASFHSTRSTCPAASRASSARGSFRIEIDTVLRDGDPRLRRTPNATARMRAPGSTRRSSRATARCTTPASRTRSKCGRDGAGRRAVRRGARRRVLRRVDVPPCDRRVEGGAGRRWSSGCGRAGSRCSTPSGRPSTSSSSARSRSRASSICGCCRRRSRSTAGRCLPTAVRRARATAVREVLDAAQPCSAAAGIAQP